MQELSFEEKLNIINAAPTFKSMSLAARQFLAYTATTEYYLKDSIIFSANKQLNYLYLIRSGIIDIVVGEKTKFKVAQLSNHEILGEMSFVADTLTSATAKARTDIVLLVFHKSDFTSDKRLSDLIQKFHIDTGIQNNPFHFYLNLTHCLFKTVNSRIIKRNNYLIETLNDKLKLQSKLLDNSRLLILISVTMSLYVYFLHLIIKLIKHSTISTIVSTILLFILACVAIYYIKISKKPLKDFGLTLKNWKADILETLTITLLIMLLLLFIKLGLITLFPKFHAEPLFHPYASLRPGHRATTSVALLSFFIVLYAIFAFVQEFIARGIIQSQLKEIFTGKYRTLNTILIANLLFAVMHIQISLLFVIVVFIFGLYWGWLYNRQQSLVGVSFSHILIGIFGNFLLNFNFIVL